MAGYYGVSGGEYMKKPFWIIFLKDPMNGIITGAAYGHNAKADYKNNPYYIGTHKVEIDLDKLK